MHPEENEQLEILYSGDDELITRFIKSGEVR